MTAEEEGASGGERLGPHPASNGGLGVARDGSGRGPRRRRRRRSSALRLRRRRAAEPAKMGGGVRELYWVEATLGEWVVRVGSGQSELAPMEVAAARFGSELRQAAAQRWPLGGSVINHGT